ncbi:halocyanin [Natronococcus sp.]|uniref:halocyanin n=1 Tax=Natronococcus sp. TaxID=35747 RepID=UPI003A4DB9FF
MPNPAFEPNVVHVEPGATVRWALEGNRHTVTAYHPDTHGPQRIPDGAEPWESGTLSSTADFEWTFEEEGLYDYVDTRTLCATHEALGAVGRVVVGWPELEGQPAVEPASRELPDAAAESIDRKSDRVREILEEEHGRA